MKKMTVNEMIEKLENLKLDGKGDYEIAVQYSDEGGYYVGVDFNISFDVDDTERQVIL